MNQKIINEIKKKTKLKWDNNLIGIIIFGSCIEKKKNYRDIDLLVVLENINKNRVERINEIVDFKRTLEIKKPVDITLISRGECEENFRNHNPLYLDIALDGEIVLDEDGTLKELIEETLGYIENKDIVRKGTKWIFPIKRGIATLSRINNKDWAESWLKDAKRDLKAAKSLHEENLFEKAIYHSQQCVEKSVKAILICFGIFEKTHFVSITLKEETKKRKLKDKKIDELISISESLEPHVSLSRYPGISKGEIWLPYEEYDDKTVKESLNNAGRAMKIAKEFVDEWFWKFYDSTSTFLFRSFGAVNSINSKSIFANDLIKGFFWLILNSRVFPYARVEVTTFKSSNIPSKLHIK